MARAGQTANSEANGATNSADGTWSLTVNELADVKFKEITSFGIAVRGDISYNVCSLDETVLFDTDKVVIKPGAVEYLQQVTGSIG